MNQDNEKQKKKLAKKEWLRYARKPNPAEDHPYRDAFSRRAIKGLQYVRDEEDARQSLQRLESRVEQRVNAKKTTPRLASFLIKVAAAVLLLLIPFSIVWYDARPVSSQTAFERHFYPVTSNIPQSGPLREGAAEAETDLLRQAILDYENDSFASANEKFVQYLQTAPADIDVRFYYGVSLLAEGRATAAINQLKQVRRQSSVAPYRIPAQWYLGLAHLKLGQQAEAIAQLKPLANQTKSTHYREKAEALLLDIN